MARPTGIRRPVRPPAGHIHKAVRGGQTLPGGLQLPAGGMAADATSMISALPQMTGQSGYVNTTSRPLPRTAQEFFALFGPGAPLFPQPLNEARVDTGQPEPRKWQYPVSWNIQDQNYERLVDWDTLRGAADRVDIIRRCIEIRKAEIVQMDWDIGLSRRAMERAGANTAGEKSSMRDQFSGEIARLTDWWETPDKTNGLSWSDWIMQLLEEFFVLDALSIYPRMTFGGELSALEIIDGSTIKPLLDQRGNIPGPPAPAYQQWLYGFPRGEYTDLGAGNPDMTMQAGQLIYRPRNRRTWTPYGYSPTEQALVTADIYLRRQDWMRQEYTAGTMPRSWLKTDLAANTLTPEQIRNWNTVLNDFLSGSTENRQKVNMLPYGYDPVSETDVAERYKAEYDELLIKLLAGNFDVDPMELGITPKSGLGGKGMAEESQNAKERRGTAPLMEWLVDVLNGINRNYLGAPAELTFTFSWGDSDDEKTADAIGNSRVESGRVVMNEERDRQGLPRYDGEWADKPFVNSATGPIWLDKAWEQASEPPAPVPPALAAHAGVEPGDAPRPGETPPAPARTPPEPPQPEDGEAKKAEAAAYRRFVKKGPRGREFQFQHHSGAEITDLVKAVGGEVKVVERPASQESPKVEPAVSPQVAKADDAEFNRMRNLMQQPPVTHGDRRVRYRTGRDDHLELGVHQVAKQDSPAPGPVKVTKTGDARGRGGAPEGARRGDEPEHAGYPLRPAGTPA